ncbi:MAG TPA: hypothetical protein VLU91_08465 [Nitrososphaerales archaeon]|jgi:hypothetical protein|nr:hypothetical protein [Nitrososphaerales archaeon]
MAFLEKLVDRSSLTPRQLEALSSYVRVALGEIKFREAASLASAGRKKGSLERPLTVGSYYRTVSQARTNVRESLVTVVIALWLGLIKVEDLRRLFDLIGSGPRELSEEEADHFARLLDALLGRIVV